MAEDLVAAAKTCGPVRLYVEKAQYRSRRDEIEAQLRQSAAVPEAAPA